jgi:F-type H+-transporting ATPase subunit gamma
MIIRTSVLGCFSEAAVSEHLARVVSMRNASENADEMIKELTKDYNRARQGQITVELLDIVSGWRRHRKVKTRIESPRRGNDSDKSVKR